MKVEKVQAWLPIGTRPTQEFSFEEQGIRSGLEQDNTGQLFDFKLSPDLFFFNFKKIQNPQRTDDFHEIYGKELAVLKKVM